MARRRKERGREGGRATPFGDSTHSVRSSVVRRRAGRTRLGLGDNTMSNEATNSHNSFSPSLLPPLENTGLLVRGSGCKEGRWDRCSTRATMNNLLVQQVFLYLLVGLDKNGTLLRCHHSSGKREKSSSNYSERLYIFPRAAAATALDFLANHSPGRSPRSLAGLFPAYQDNRMLSCLTLPHKCLN